MAGGRYDLWSFGTLNNWVNLGEAVLKISGIAANLSPRGLIVVLVRRLFYLC